MTECNCKICLSQQKCWGSRCSAQLKELQRYSKESAPDKMSSSEVTGAPQVVPGMLYFNRTILKWWKCDGITPMSATRKKYNLVTSTIFHELCVFLEWLFQIIMKYRSWSIVAHEVKVVFKQGLHAQACNGYINFHLSSFICWSCTGWLWDSDQFLSQLELF